MGIEDLIEKAGPSPRSSPEIEAKSQEVRNAIAQFGDSYSTDWLDNKYHIWVAPGSDEEGLAIQGYMLDAPWVFAWGTPACPDGKLEETVCGFSEWCVGQGYAPLWLCVDEPTKDVLINNLDWNVLCCTREDVIDLNTVALTSKDLLSNVKAAGKKGVKIRDFGNAKPNDDVVDEVNRGIADWLKRRHGLQVASDSLDVWLDSEHRRYFVATAEGRITGVCNLARLKHSTYQIKNQITFPGAPRGTSEQLLKTVIEVLKSEGIQTLTFGGSAADELLPIHNLKGWKMTWLSAIYKQILFVTNLTNRGTFRHKFGVHTTPSYIAFPASSMPSFSSILRFMKFFTSSS